MCPNLPFQMHVLTSYYHLLLYLPDVGETHLWTVVKIPALNSMLEMDNLQYLVLNCAVCNILPSPLSLLFTSVIRRITSP